MKGRPLSLKTLIIMAFLTMTILLVVGYTCISINFYGRGLDSIITDHLVQTIVRYTANGTHHSLQEAQHFDGHLITPDWQLIPQDIRRNLAIPTEDGSLQKYAKGGWPDRPEYMHFATRFTVDGQTFYIVHRLTPEMVSPLVGRQGMETLRTLLSISVLTIIFLCFFTWILLRKAVRPGRALRQWAAGLDAETLHKVPPDFSYPELNELAGLIQRSLLSVRESLEREQLFVRYSSHELRTPVSVIRNNLELLKKFKASHMCDAEKEAEVLQRIHRAGTTMQNLMETLLWLGREDMHSLPLCDVDMETLLHEIVEEARYLLHDRKVDVVVDCETCVLHMPTAAARIVLGNLVRNAFQHTLRGVIHIVQREKTVEIVNYMAAENDMARDTGFGLGLQLVRRLADKLGWVYEEHAYPGRHSAMLGMDTPGTALANPRIDLPLCFLPQSLPCHTAPAVSPGQGA